jgi:GntR family transcriptional regulator / MocR family aminotransferase
MGVPAQETLPARLFTKVRSFALRAESSASVVYPDPRGEPALRREIAAYLAIARGITCSSAQIVITSGFSGGLGLTLRVLGLEGGKAWVEDPGFPFARHGLTLAKMSLSPIPVEVDGIDLDYGLRHAPDAALVVVTAGQQAPLGPTLSLARRLQLLDWAAKQGVWVIEDDYLSELQLTARAAPALASLDRAYRVIHIGSFSKTISPALTHETPLFRSTRRAARMPRGARARDSDGWSRCACTPARRCVRRIHREGNGRVWIGARTAVTLVRIIGSCSVRTAAGGRNLAGEKPRAIL